MERHEVFSRYHNSIVGHHGVEHTLKAMSLGGHAPKRFGMDQRVFHMPEDQIPTSSGAGRGGTSLSPLTSISVDTMGPLREDENENYFVIIIVDNFSKLIGPPRSCDFTMGTNFWCSERDPKRWRFVVYVQDGSGHSFLAPFSCSGVPSRS